MMSVCHQISIQNVKQKVCFHFVFINTPTFFFFFFLQYLDLLLLYFLLNSSIPTCCTPPSTQFSFTSQLLLSYKKSEKQKYMAGNKVLKHLKTPGPCLYCSSGFFCKQTCCCFYSPKLIFPYNFIHFNRSWICIWLVQHSLHTDREPWL